MFLYVYRCWAVQRARTQSAKTEGPVHTAIHLIIEKADQGTGRIMMYIVCRGSTLRA
ncbi:hypothetical protein POSPLADRAFT_1038339 [Postia placenta MAD-698-R-SB12]|uniref:Uncharacterized protein n=1 Tax=Postia placenta MAD-698-R-SB12 TaxID=670580 RepID=A0A1X6NHU5_9APHY|nr:hypothetical protein POSPLADRAFT_1038339 [Postia placenta MAD-698-R-SB12]OSX68208.1 hypothetical protein POSPLADRAFT_1038339 [Postia placenta MAD-698-R-SB12]